MTATTPDPKTIERALDITQTVVLLQDRITQLEACRDRLQTHNSALALQNQSLKVTVAQLVEQVADVGDALAYAGALGENDLVEGRTPGEAVRGLVDALATERRRLARSLSSTN